MNNIASFSKTAMDWKITSYGDIGGFAGYGGKLAHFRFYSPSLNLKMHTILASAGVGVGLNVTPGFLSSVKNALERFFKAKGAATAESSYTALECHRPFSLNDIDGANAGAIDTALAITFGYKVGYCHCSGSKSGPAGGALIFSIPASVDPTFTITAEASSSAGIFISLDGSNLAQIDNSRREREFARRPSDPLVRPAGGF
jgi:hypothetical protein